MHETAVQGVLAFPGPDIDRRINAADVGTEKGADFFQLKQFITARPGVRCQVLLNLSYRVGIAVVVGPLLELGIEQQRVCDFGGGQVDAGQMLQVTGP